MNRMNRITPLRPATVLAALVLAAGCGDLFVSTTDFASVEVEITRRSGEPVPDTRVVLFTGERPEAEGRTGLNGRLVFERVPTHLPERTFGVRVHPSPGWEWIESITDDPVVSFQDGIRVAEGERVTVSFTLMKRGHGAVEVVVGGPEGEPVPDAELFLFSLTNEHEDTGATGADGRFLFEDVPFGRYRVEVRAPPGYVADDGGAETVVGDALVEEDVVETLEVELLRAPD